MRMKKTIKSIAGKVIFNRLRRKQLPHIKILVRGLKKSGIYNKYPVDKVSPVIKQYSFFRNTDLFWLDFYYSVFGKPDQNFISVPIYYYIESCLNDRMLMYAIKEKNFYNKFLKEIPTPKSLVRGINGFYFDRLYNRIEPDQIQGILTGYRKIIFKPSVESGGGDSVIVFERSGKDFTDGVNLLNEEYLKKTAKDFVIQEFIVQHDYFSQFNPSSNNTIRVLTYRSVKDDNINILHCLLRIGAKGSFLDHDHLGGVVLSIDDQNKVGKYAIDRQGFKCNEVNKIDLTSIGEVPSMGKIRMLAKEISNSIYYGRILALDFTIDKDGNPLLIEINCWRNGISQYQMHNGGLFKEFTNEILDYCQNRFPGFVFKI